MNCGTCGDSWIPIQDKMNTLRKEAKRIADEKGKAYAIYKEKYTGEFKITDAAEAREAGWWIWEVIR